MGSPSLMTDGGRLAGKVALVTGVGSGIGREVALAFAREGATVVGGCRTPEALASLAEELRGPSLLERCDVTCEEDQAALVAAGVERFGRLDVAVANAGGATFGPVVDLEADEFRRVVDLCLTGCFLTFKHTGRAMAAAGGGSLIAVASLNATQPGYGLGAYCAAKAGMKMLAEVTALELGAKGVRCNTIAPVYVTTPATAAFQHLPGVLEQFADNTPLPQTATPADVASVAVFLASDDSAHMSAAYLAVDGGASTGRYPRLLEDQPA